MADEHNVFLRWARLKQASKQGREAEIDPAAPPAPEAASDEPFDLSSLPPIESIAANTDIAAFLRNGVPAELTRAALRRAWTSDPAIRDFIGIAENQWDFNDPNAIVGFGPLDPGETSADILAQLSRRLEQIPDTLADAAAPPAPVRPAPVASAEPVIDQPPVSAEPSLDAGPKTRSNEPPERAPNTEMRDAPRKHRHGSALPR